MLYGIAEALQMHLLRLQKMYVAGVCIIFTLFICGVWFLSAPVSFTSRAVIEIPQGTAVGQAGLILREHHAIRSQFLFKVLARMSGTSSIQAGAYLFPPHVLMPDVLWRLRTGNTGQFQLRVTFPEGYTLADMSALLASTFPGFDQAEFATLTSGKEGYLFPDTYFFVPGVAPSVVVASLEENYERHASWRNDIPAGMTEKEVITLASIVESEAKTPEDKKIVAGILLNRLAHGQRLQVDAPFGYEKGIRGYVPTAKDINTPTPYNTYRSAGLPPTPINNPGLISIEAVVHPTKTDYVYYITGSDGKMYYSKTFADHQTAIREHLQ